MKQLQLTADRLSIGLSCLCIVHCLLLPVAFVAFPMLASLAVADEMFHQVLVMFVLPFSLVALFMGYRRHHQTKILGWGILGLIVLVMALLLGHDLLGEYGEVLLTVMGSLLIAYSHIRNFVVSKQLCV